MVSVQEIERVMKLFSMTGLWRRVGPAQTEKPLAAPGVAVSKEHLKKA